MKYFTPKLYARLQSTDDDEIVKVDAEWEWLATLYERRLTRIRSQLPRPVRFLLDKLYLHDADVIDLGREGDSFIFVLRLDTQAIPQQFCSSHVEWMYDEVNIVPRKRRFTHEILLSNGWQIRLRFRDLRVTVTQGLLQPDQPGNGTVRQAMAQPA